MSEFTYELTDLKEKYETYEWDNLWIDHARDISDKRVLYIGDSISCGTRHIATKRTNEKIYFDGFGTSKGIDNPYFMPSLKLFADQEARRDAVIFNNGLHGWHLEDETEYSHYYEEMIKFLLEEFKNTPIAVVLTTYIVNEERHKRVVCRNKAAKEIAEKYNLPIIDLYSVSVDNANLLTEDGVHFAEKGYELFADEIIRVLNEIIK